MLGVLEKIVWALSGIAIAGCGLWWAILGPPPNTPQIACSSRQEDEAKATEGLSEEQKQDLQEIIVRGITAPEGAAPSAAAKKPSKPKPTYYRVNRAVYNRVSNMNRAMHELKKGKSELLEDKDGDGLPDGLRIFDFDKDSLFGFVGLEENDVVKAVNGEHLDFGSRGALVDLYNANKDKMETGEPVVITVERGGALQTLVFSLDFLEK